MSIWVRSRNCGCLVTWFCYQLIAKPGNKTAAVPWPDPYIHHLCLCVINTVYNASKITLLFMSKIDSSLNYNQIQQIVKRVHNWYPMIHYPGGVSEYLLSPPKVFSRGCIFPDGVPNVIFPVPRVQGITLGVASATTNRPPISNRNYTTYCRLLLPSAKYNTVQCRYNVNFLQNPHNRHPITHPWELNLCALYQSLQCCI